MSRRIGIAAAIWAAGLFLSRVLGVGRDAVFGRIVGGGEGADLYVSAFTIPDFLNYLLAGGALSIVFIPIFSEYLDRGEDERGWRAFSTISTVVGIGIVVYTAIGWVLTPWVNAWVFSGYDAAALSELDAMTRVLLPAQIFHVVGAILSAALQARDRHTLPALAPLVYNGAIIAGGLIGGAEAGPWGFIWGVLVGSILGPFGTPLIGCIAMGLRYRPRIAWDADLKRYLWQSFPIMVAFGIVMVDDWILKSFASGLQEGAAATLHYAKLIMKVPMGVFGLALGAAAFPTLARLVDEGRSGDAYTTLSRSLTQMLVLALGAQVVFSVVGAEVARVLFGDRLLPGQHEAIGLALALFCLGLWAWSAHGVLARGFYAMKQTWPPSVLGTITAVLLLPLYAVLSWSFGTAGLAVASTVAISVYVLGLGIWLRRVYRDGEDHFLSFFLRILPALGLGIGVGWGARTGLLTVLPGGLEDVVETQLVALGLTWFAGEAGALVQGALIGSLALGVYVAAVLVLRVPGSREVVSLLRRKILRRAA